MGFDGDSDEVANLVIGPTSLGMVRILVKSSGVELPMDFEPGEAVEIADELRTAAKRARATGAPRAGRREAGNEPGGRIRVGQRSGRRG